jgi:UDP-3-O-[3-hydroxymyristoyl] glucosamine N-acyltransferase
MKLKDLASRLGLELQGDGELEISSPAPLEAAGAGTVTFLAHSKYLPLIENSMASCVITSADLAPKMNRATLISANPYLDFARTLEIFFPSYRPPPGIHPSALIAPDATIGEGASIGAYCVIGAGVRIGRAAVIHPHVTIYPGVRIGDDFTCHSQVSIRDNVTIGNGVVIHNGAVIGADGFGFVEYQENLVKIPQVGGVTIEDQVELGAHVTIDRATVGATVIRRGAKLDNLVHIGHNCEIGEFSRFAAQVGIAGSVVIGKWCEFGGQAGCADHARIGDRVRVAAKSGIPGDVADGVTIGGIPAVEIRTWRRMVAAMPRLPEVFRRLRMLEAGVGSKKSQ